MSAHLRRVVLAMTIVFGVGMAAQAPPITHGRGPLETTEGMLRRHRIQLNTAALVEALQSRDAEVRWLAAAKLADDKAKDAVPAIVNALVSEGVPSARVNIAFSLARLGELKGLDALREICADSDAPAAFRLIAARYLSHLTYADAVCRAALVDILEAEAGYATLSEAVSLLLKGPELGPIEMGRVFRGLGQSLSNNEAAARLAASAALRDIGGPSAVPLLQRAIASEHDDTVRSAMQAHLRSLQRKGRSVPPEADGPR